MAGGPIRKSARGQSKITSILCVRPARPARPSVHPLANAVRVQLRRRSRSQVSRQWLLQTGRSSARPAGSLPRRPSCWWSMPSCKQTRVAGRSVPVRCAGAAQLLVEHAQLLVGMPIRVFSLWTVCVLSSRLFRGHGDVLHSRQRCPLIPLTGVSMLVPNTILTYLLTYLHLAVGYLLTGTA